MFYLEFNLRILHFFIFIIAFYLMKIRIISDYVIIVNFPCVIMLRNVYYIIMNYVITPFCGEKGKKYYKNWKNNYGLSQLYLVWITINPRNTHAKSMIECHRVEQDGSQEDYVTVFISPGMTHPVVGSTQTAPPWQECSVSANGHLGVVTWHECDT